MLAVTWRAVFVDFMGVDYRLPQRFPFRNAGVGDTASPTCPASCSGFEIIASASHTAREAVRLDTGPSAYR